MIALWPEIALSEIVQPVLRHEKLMPGKLYRQIGVRLWGRGAYERETIDGKETKYKTLSLMCEGDIVVSKIWARNGSVAVVSKELDGTYGSSEFPTFVPISDYLDPMWFHWITKKDWFWRQCEMKSHGTSGKNRIRPDKFLEIKIPLPPIEEQRHIVSQLGKIAARITEAKKLQENLEQSHVEFFSSLINESAKDAPRQMMKGIAPIIRRSIEIQKEKDYPELGIRSFGKGAFHKPAIKGSEIGSKRLYRIEPGDLLFSNVFAWEGAIAVAQPYDKDRYGSHRFITCLPVPELVTANYLKHYFLSKAGLAQIRSASPGAAGRNKTLNLKKLEAIEVPVPPIEQQRHFDILENSVSKAFRIQSQCATELETLMPAILDKAFKGEL